jgi:hypothetical protein
MSLSDFAAIGSFVSGIAVVVSFVFLALQIRQSNLNQRSLIQQGRSARRIDLLLRRADPDLSDIMERAFRGDPSLSPRQIMSYFLLVQAIFEGYEDTFLQHKAGTIDELSWETEIVHIRGVFANMAIRIGWLRVRNDFAKDFRELIDALMAETKVEIFGDISRTWKAAVIMESRRAGRAAK